MPNYSIPPWMQNTPDPVSAYVRGISLGQAAAARQDAANRSAQEMAIQQARAAENAILRQEQMAVQSEYHKNLIRLKEDEDRRKNESAAARMMAWSQYQNRVKSLVDSGMEMSKATQQGLMEFGPQLGMTANQYALMNKKPTEPRVGDIMTEEVLPGVYAVRDSTSNKLHMIDLGKGMKSSTSKPPMTPAQELAAMTAIGKLRSESAKQMNPELGKLADKMQAKLDSFSGTSSQPSEPMLGGVPALGWFSDTLGSRPSVPSVPTVQTNSLPGVESAPERSGMEEPTDEETADETESQPKELTREVFSSVFKEMNNDKQATLKRLRELGYQ